MSRWWKWINPLFCPPVAVILLLAVSCGCALVFIFLYGLPLTLPAYFIYSLSAYTLTVSVLRAVSTAKRIKSRLVQNRHVQRYTTDLYFKSEVSLYLSLAVTFFYCVCKAAAAIHYRSTWLGSLAFYYLVLAGARFLLLYHLRSDKENGHSGRWLHRILGCILLVLTMALSVISFYSITQKHTIEYPGFMIYAAAFFTFYNLTMAAWNLIRYRKLHAPVHSASKVLALSSSLVSLFFLQTAMLSSFGNGGSWQNDINIATGSFVFLLIAYMAMRMLYKKSDKTQKPSAFHLES